MLKYKSIFKNTDKFTKYLINYKIYQVKKLLYIFLFIVKQLIMRKKKRYQKKK